MVDRARRTCASIIYLSSPEILSIAEKVVKTAVGAYAKSNLTPQEIKNLALSNGDPL